MALYDNQPSEDRMYVPVEALENLASKLDHFYYVLCEIKYLSELSNTECVCNRIRELVSRNLEMIKSDYKTKESLS